MIPQQTTQASPLRASPLQRAVHTATVLLAGVLLAITTSHACFAQEPSAATSKDLITP
ncbi:MAG: hypothetical protein IH898_10580, partial [Planctomycetes bacterium]|nr:hypothetical protein [Planctomycetota bacterium]